MKTKAIFVIAAAAMVFSLASCEKDPDRKEPVEPVEAAGEVSGVWEAGSTVYVDGHIVVPEGESLTIEETGSDTLSGNVSGVWESGRTIFVDGHLVVPEGESLTIEEGVTVIFSDAGVGVNHTAIEFSVDGNLYCLGTEENPVRLTVAEDLRTADNTFAGLWGGIVAGATSEEMLIDHTIIEYCGGQVIEGSPAAENGYYTAGDDAYPHITTNNVDGRYVITNSILRNGWSDAIYMMGGNAIIAGNIFSAIGYDGAEAVNVKSGCTVDVTRNIMFSANTNGLKLSSSDQSEVRHQAKIQFRPTTTPSSVPAGDVTERKAAESM